jgi:hypothetical protein
MFFFFGMHTTRKDCGPEGYHTCTRCGHVGDWRLINETTWLILMLIPIPIKVRYYSMCQGCGGTSEMTKEEFLAAAEK